MAGTPSTFQAWPCRRIRHQCSAWHSVATVTLQLGQLRRRRRCRAQHETIARSSDDGQEAPGPAVPQHHGSVLEGNALLLGVALLWGSYPPARRGDPPPPPPPLHTQPRRLAACASCGSKGLPLEFARLLVFVARPCRYIYMLPDPPSPVALTAARGVLQALLLAGAAAGGNMRPAPSPEGAAERLLRRAAPPGGEPLLVRLLPALPLAWVAGLELGGWNALGTASQTLGLSVSPATGLLPPPAPQPLPCGAWGRRPAHAVGTSPQRPNQACCPHRTRARSRTLRADDFGHARCFPDPVHGRLHSAAVHGAGAGAQPRRAAGLGAGAGRGGSGDGGHGGRRGRGRRRAYRPALW